jgi:hypothetical protein
MRGRRLSVFNRNEESGITRGERAVLALPDDGNSRNMRSTEARARRG